MHTTYTKTITRAHGEYRASLDGQLVGYYRTHLAAQTALDTLVYDLLSEGQCASAAQLDGGSDADVMAAEVAGMVAGGDPCDAPYLLTIPTSIDYDAATHTYDLRVGGEFVGIAHTEAEAQAALSRRVPPAYLVGYQAGVAAYARRHAPAEMAPAEYLARLQRDLGLTD